MSFLKCHIVSPFALKGTFYTSVPCVPPKQYMNTFKHSDYRMCHPLLHSEAAFIPQTVLRSFILSSELRNKLISIQSMVRFVFQKEPRVFLYVRNGIVKDFIRSR